MAHSEDQFSVDERIAKAKWERYVVLSHVICCLAVRDRRRLFQLGKGIKGTPDENTFFPEYGFTMGEFSVWYVLAGKKK